MTQFTISFNDKQLNDCLIGLIATQDGSKTQFDINLLNCSSDKQQKHNLHSLSQIALYQFEDQEIDVQPINGCCTIKGRDFDYALAEGLILIQRENNRIEIHAHENINVRKGLDAAYRYCTRWIRLDL